MDDKYMVVERTEVYVARQPRIKIPSLDEIPDRAVTSGTGSYRMRLDGLGQRVPHDLTGTVEFDWQGWGGSDRAS